MGLAEELKQLTQKNQARSTIESTLASLPKDMQRLLLLELISTRLGEDPKAAESSKASKPKAPEPAPKGKAAPAKGKPAPKVKQSSGPKMSIRAAAKTVLDKNGGWMYTKDATSGIQKLLPKAAANSIAASLHGLAEERQIRSRLVNGLRQYASWNAKVEDPENETTQTPPPAPAADAAPASETPSS